MPDFRLGFWRPSMSLGSAAMTKDVAIRFTDGSAYERFMTPWSRTAGAEFLAWLAVPPGRSWLDVGCGNGAFTELVLAQCAPSQLCGIDPSDAQVDFARQKLAGQPVDLSVGDAMALPYADGRFDVSVMALVLFFVTDPLKGAAEMVRVTKPDGLVASYTWDATRGGRPSEHVAEELQAMGKNPARPPSEDISRFESLKALWAGLGLVEIETREIVVRRTFADFEDYWQSMVVCSPGAILTRITEAEAAELRHRLIARLPVAGSGEITLHAWATAIKGRKRA